MDIPKLSINMVTYNRALFIEEALNSILAQSFQDWELIIIDDGSNDNSGEIIKKYQQNDKRIKYIKNELNLGVVKSRNKALENSQGKYIAVLDSDDVWCCNDKLKKQLEIIENKNCILVGSNVIVIDEEGQEKNRYFYPLSDQEIRNSFLIKNPLAHSSTVFLKEVVLQVGGYDDTLVVCEDYDLFLKIGKLGKIMNLTDFLLKYRKHESNLSQNKIVQVLRDNLKIIKKYKNDYPNYFYAWIRRGFRLIVGKLFL